MDLEDDNSTKGTSLLWKLLNSSSLFCWETFFSHHWISSSQEIYTGFEGIQIDGKTIPKRAKLLQTLLKKEILVVSLILTDQSNQIKALELNLAAGMMPEK
ncbi:hypothetical protein ACSBR1_039318 [Camellia fascicularis]